MRGRVVLLSVIGLGVLLFMAAASSAATFRNSITGSGQTGSADPAFIQVAASSDVGGANPSGSINQTYASGQLLPSTSQTDFHGDVSQGCVRVQGNRAIVVGRLPANEEFDIAGFGRIVAVAAFVEENGAAGAAPVDRARPILLRATSAANFCANSFDNVFATGTVALDSGDFGFTYTDTLDAHPANPDSVVSIVDRAGLPVTVTDAGDPLGVQVAVGAGSGSATFDACGFVVTAAAGSTVDVTCGSVILGVIAGSAQVVLGDGLAVISIPAGGEAEVSDDGTGGVTVENLGSVPVTVTVDGVTSSIGPGETSAVETWDFEGFFRPVSNLPVLTKAQAGSTVSLKWRLLDETGAPVANLLGATITVSPRDCETGDATGAAVAAAGSALQNLGGGSYQLNWKTQKSYAGTCQTLHLDVGDGVTHDAAFDFRKK